MHGEGKRAGQGGCKMCQEGKSWKRMGQEWSSVQRIGKGTRG